MSHEHQRGIFWSVVAGAAMGFFPGMLAHRALTDNPLPIETFDWVIKNGTAGFALVGLAVLGGVHLAERKGRIRDRDHSAVEMGRVRDAHAAEMTRVRDACAAEMRSAQDRHDARMDAVRGEIVPALRRNTRALIVTTEAVRGHAVTPSELDDLEGETPPDPVPLPKRG